MTWLKSKTWLYRAVRTFLQAFTGYIATNVTLYLTGVDYTDKTVLKTALVGLVTPALAAAVAAVMNLKSEDTTES